MDQTPALRVRPWLRRRRTRRYLGTATMVLVGFVSATACGSGDGSSTPKSAVGTPTVSTSIVPNSTPASATSPSPSTSRSPAGTATPATEEAQIRAAFLAFFDGAAANLDKKVGLLENGEKYRQMLVDASANAQFQKLSATVRSVQFPADAGCAPLGVASPCAKVTFDLLVGGFPMLAAHESPAVKIGGAWKVAAKAWCDVVAIGGDSCPA